MNDIAIEVPDIGDFSDVTVIEILVQVGDTIQPEQSLITVESDKASMEIPSSHGGVIKALHVQLGDTVNQGSLLLTLSTNDTETTTTSTPPQPTTAPANETKNSSYAGDTIPCDVLVLGGGPGGYSAAFRAADLGLKVILVERYASLGGVCLNVGCIPSKALLHVAEVIEEATQLKAAGVNFGTPTIHTEQLRAHKQKIVGQLTSGLAKMAAMRKVQVLRGHGEFIGSHQLQVEETTGSGQEKTGNMQVVQFTKAIIAVGSCAVQLPFLPKDPRIIDSTAALDIHTVPKNMLIIGGGIIGLEMGTVYSALGARLDVVEMLDSLMPGADQDLVKVWQKSNQHRFERILLNTKVTAADAKPEGITVQFEAQDGTQSEGVYDLVLQAVGRSPNGARIAAEQAGLPVTEQGFIQVDAQMRTAVPHLFAIGDVVGQPMLAHKAVHEAHVAAEVIAGELLNDTALSKRTFNARVIPSVAYTSPEVAWVGLTEAQAKAQGIAIQKGVFPWSASGRAIANGCSSGFTKLLFAHSDNPNQPGKILGGGIVGLNAGDLIGEIALAIEMGADHVDIGQTIHPHPTLGESIGMAAEAAHGACTDLPPVKNKGTPV